MLLAGPMMAKSDADGIPTDGLVAAYDLDSNLIDSIGGFNGTAVSTITYTSGHIGQAIDGDGANYVSLPNLGISGGTPRTISFWYKMGASTAIKTITGWNGATSENLTNCICHASAVSAGDVYWGFGNSDFHTGGGVLNSSVYKHIALVYSGGTLSTSTVKIYVNTTSQPLTGAGAVIGDANTTSANYRLMSDSLGPRISDGKLDLVRIYNRALSALEVSLLYNEV